MVVKVDSRSGRRRASTGDEGIKEQILGLTDPLPGWQTHQEWGSEYWCRERQGCGSGTLAAWRITDNFNTEATLGAIWGHELPSCWGAYLLLCLFYEWKTHKGPERARMTPRHLQFLWNVQCVKWEVTISWEVGRKPCLWEVLRSLSGQRGDAAWQQNSSQSKPRLV